MVREKDFLERNYIVNIMKKTFVSVTVRGLFFDKILNI